MTSILFVHGTRSITRHTFGCSEYPKVTRSLVRYKFLTYFLTHSSLRFQPVTWRTSDCVRWLRFLLLIRLVAKLLPWRQLSIDHHRRRAVRLWDVLACIESGNVVSVGLPPSTNCLSVPPQNAIVVYDVPTVHDIIPACIKKTLKTVISIA